ncbi:uncharacterized protein LOC122504766 isoform X2 [Leptopilina heterotoma]|uniref:uncharacterized protein LOC122504766 isoform X2 n=1 Tax=Leptopilina heterotoma TaxID=63436 RepID=UPI001CA86D30|nr:uncharacterized protein LOC122504766 isoform X2 [Leptopilina heterotoma]
MGFVLKNFGLLLIFTFFITSIKSAQATEQGRLIQENAHKIVAEAGNDESLHRIPNRQDEILKIVELIENGTPPADVNSNTTSLSTNINGRIITIKDTIYSSGNEKEGAIHNVKSTYDEAKKIDLSINTILWDQNGLRKYFINDGGSQVISTNGNAKIFINN